MSNSHSSLGPALDAAAVVDELDRALAGTKRPALAFDADFTLWDGDVGIAMFDALVAEGGPRPEARDALAVEARQFGVANGAHATATAPELARALYAAWSSGAYPEDRAFAMMAWAFAGFTRGEARAFAARVLDAMGLEQLRRPELEPVFAWARAKAVPVYVVSASPDFAVAVAVAKLDVPEARVVGMRPAKAGSHGPNGAPEAAFAPRLEGPATYGPGKLEALRARAGELELVGAFGDSGFDAPLLRRAKVGVAVAPGSALLELAAAGELAGVRLLATTPRATPGGTRP